MRKVFATVDAFLCLVTPFPINHPAQRSAFCALRRHCVQSFQPHGVQPQRQEKIRQNPMFYEVPELENLTVESPLSYQLAKLAFENKALLV
jgi:hypothetical protein